jgi:hypothetical protein
VSEYDGSLISWEILTNDTDMHRYGRIKYYSQLRMRVKLEQRAGGCRRSEAFDAALRHEAVR